MSTPAREVVVAPVALERMISDKPSAEEREAIRNILTDLASKPLLGYEIAFLTPLTYRVDAGRFRIHYRFDDREVRVGFIGVY